MARLIVVLACAGGVASCALNPVSGRPELVVVTQEQEKALGDQEAQKVEEQIGLVDDATLTEYVSAVGQRVAAQSPRQNVTYRFFVVDMAAPNAFALPNGNVYVTRGLLALLNSEDELAGILGHEIGHVAARHSVQKMSTAAPLAVLTGLGATAAGIASPILGQVVGGAGQLASGAVLAPYSRQQEREADRVGQEMAAKAGWDPAATATFLTTLERTQQLEGQAAPSARFFDSHPAGPERVATTEAYARELTRVDTPPISPDRAAFLGHLDGVVVGPRAAEGVFDGQTFLHPDLDFAITFPDGWKTRNTRTQVAAVSPDGAALVLLESIGSGSDPMLGARAVEKASHASIVANTQRVKLGALDAARTRLQANSRNGPVLLEVTWIAYRDTIYQVVGVAPVAGSGTYVPVFERVAGSFRPLTAPDRDRIREDRLRVARATGTESIPALAARTRSVWTPDQIAAANALDPDAVLSDGTRVKITLRELYLSGAGRP